jgi:hypothetical protein
MSVAFGNPELGIRSFSKLIQTDHIGRWGGAESEPL